MEGSLSFLTPKSQTPDTSKRRVVITGIGVVSPIGTGLEKFWANLVQGESGIGKITLFDASTFPCQIAAEVKDFEPEKYLAPRQIRYHSRASQFCCVAFAMAKSDAKIEFFDPFRTDVIIGTAVSSFGIIEDEILKRPDGIGEYKGVEDPSAMFKAIVSAPSTSVALMAQTSGYVTTVSSACTSGINALGLGYTRIAGNQANIVICGGVDTPINRLVLASFCAANFLTTNNDFMTAIRPFDTRHTKSVLSEGAGIFILEEFEHAKARNARIYAEITSFNQETENINEIFLLDKSGDRWAAAIEKTVRGKKLSHINAHAPSDLFIDRVEAKAIAKVLGESRHRTPVSSIKGSVGGFFTSAGIFQAASAALSLHTGIVPATFNHEVADPECILNFVTSNKSAKRIKRVLINSRGVGSYNTSLLMERVSI